MSVSRGSQAPSSRVPVTRRGVMHGLFAAVTAVGLASVVAASRSSRPPHCEPLSFDETYRGRRILGARTAENGSAVLDGGAFGRAAFGGGAWRVTVDGRPLHLMRRADGTYLSMVNHYQSYPTPLAAVRAAVDELGPSAQLRDTDAEGSGRHGVHA
jgi:hypothetical protein